MPRLPASFKKAFARKIQTERSKRLRSRVPRTPAEAIKAVFNLPRERTHADWVWAWRQENLLAAKESPDRARLLKVLRSAPGAKGSVMIRLSEFCEEEAHQLLQRGVRFPISDGRLVEDFVQHSRCHTNAARLWRESGGKTRIVTGLAFSGDHWYPHSWGLRGNKVVETTGEPAKVYFGVIQEPAEAEAFARAEGV